MMIRDYPKRIKKQLRDLAGLVHEKELAVALGQLAQKFDDFKSGKIGPFELNDEVHQFHQGPSRELYNKYDNCAIDVEVARAILGGILTKQDVPDEVMSQLSNLMESLRILDE